MKPISYFYIPLLVITSLLIIYYIHKTMSNKSM